MAVSLLMDVFRSGSMMLRSTEHKYATKKEVELAGMGWDGMDEIRWDAAKQGVAKLIGKVVCCCVLRGDGGGCGDGLGLV